MRQRPGDLADTFRLLPAVEVHVVHQFLQRTGAAGDFVNRLRDLVQPGGAIPGPADRISTNLRLASATASDVFSV